MKGEKFTWTVLGQPSALCKIKAMIKDASSKCNDASCAYLFRNPLVDLQ